MIVFPMAGSSARFRQAGYTVDKYRLPLWGQTVLYHVISGFRPCFEREPFLFVTRTGRGDRELISDITRRLGVQEWDLATLNHPTAGQADTVAYGIRAASVSSDEPITIFNVDTIRFNLVPPAKRLPGEFDGIIEVFRGKGTHWSFVEGDRDGQSVLRTTEKVRISNLCSTGLYFFSSATLFLDAVEASHTHGYAGPRTGAASVAPESYVAPLYNVLINQGRRVGYYSIPSSDVVFAGVPEEYEAALKAI